MLTLFVVLDVAVAVALVATDIIAEALSLHPDRVDWAILCVELFLANK